MHYKLTDPYGFSDCKQPMNSTCGSVRAPYGAHTAKYDVRAGFLPIMVVSIPLRVRKGGVRHPCGPRTGPVGYENYWRFPRGARTMPARASHGVPVEYCELFNQTISMQTCQAVRGLPWPWPGEEPRRKITTGASLGLTGKQWYGW